MSYENTNPPGAKALFDRDASAIALDVRTVEEFDGGHVTGAYNVPLAFKSPGGMEPNPEFAAVVKRIFRADAKLVLL